MNDGGPAFPHPSLWGAAGEGKVKIKEILYGMSLRDYFAAAAMSGLMDYCTAREIRESPESTAQAAWRMADAMIAARDESQRLRESAQAVPVEKAMG